MRSRARVRAPELAGRGWLNTGGREVTLAGLRGKIVVLDFWTFCCVNCLHVLDELRPLEERYIRGENDIAPEFLDYVTPLVGKLPKTARLSDFPVSSY